MIEASEAPALEQKVRPFLNAVMEIAPGTWDIRDHHAAPIWGRLRIEHAQSRLRQPDIRVKEVAIDLGFKHLSHFSKWFKRHIGPPQSVRE